MTARYNIVEWRIVSKEVNGHTFKTRTWSPTYVGSHKIMLFKLLKDFR